MTLLSDIAYFYYAIVFTLTIPYSALVVRELMGLGIGVLYCLVLLWAIFKGADYE